MINTARAAMPDGRVMFAKASHSIEDFSIRCLAGWEGSEPERFSIPIGGRPPDEQLAPILEAANKLGLTDWEREDFKEVVIVAAGFPGQLRRELLEYAHGK